MKKNKQQKIPDYIDQLNSNDKEEYMKLADRLSRPDWRNKRDHSAEKFKEMLQLVKTFAVRGNNEDASRCLACGIIWLSSALAINIQQLMKLTSKSKSSLNNSFSDLGYGSVPAHSESMKELLTKFPFMNSYAILRQWSIREIYGPEGRPTKSKQSTRSGSSTAPSQPSSQAIELTNDHMGESLPTSIDSTLSDVNDDLWVNFDFNKFPSGFTKLADFDKMLFIPSQNPNDTQQNQTNQIPN